MRALGLGILMLINLSIGLKIETKYGTVEGFPRISYRGRQFHAFEGIPYASPPIGKLRFKEPQFPEPWSGILPNKSLIKCPTVSFDDRKPFIEGTEDCLYLNIYVPNGKFLPVIVYIHGGAFRLGYAQATQPDYLMDHDVILITINYRLGPLGFLSTDDDVVSGNMGLKDQNLALKWIHDNIDKFGGNTRSITLFGISAGAASVHYHYLSDWSRGLFHRGFSISGTSLMNFALIKNTYPKTLIIADELNCTKNTNKEMIECLRNISAEEFMLASLKPYAHVSSYVMPDILYGPTVEKNPQGFLANNPFDLMSRAYDVPFIASVSKDEGIALVQFYTTSHEIPMINEDWFRYGPYILNYNETVRGDFKDKVSERVRKFYFKNDAITTDNLEDFVRLMTDRMFHVGAEVTVRKQAIFNKSPVYFFKFSFMPEHYAKFEGLKPGVAHATEEQLYFKLANSPEKLEPEEEKMTFALTKFLADFANDSVAKINNFTLSPVDGKLENFDYFEIVSSDDIRMVKSKHLAPLNFWKSLPLEDVDRNLYSSSSYAKISYILLSMNFFYLILL